MEFEIKTHSLIVLPKHGAIFDEAATIVSVEDEAAGVFFKISQCRDDTEQNVKVEYDDWQYIKRAVDTLMDEWRNK